MFDAQKQLAAFEPPTFIDKTGHRTIGRPLSHQQYQKFVADLQAAGEDEQQAEAVVRQAMLDMGLPADEVIALPDALYFEAIKDFFRCSRGEAREAPSSAAAPRPTP